MIDLKEQIRALIDTKRTDTAKWLKDAWDSEERHEIRTESAGYTSACRDVLRLLVEAEKVASLDGIAAREEALTTREFDDEAERVAEDREEALMAYRDGMGEP